MLLNFLVWDLCERLLNLSMQIRVIMISEQLMNITVVQKITASFQNTKIQKFVSIMLKFVFYQLRNYVLKKSDSYTTFDSYIVKRDLICSKKITHECLTSSQKSYIKVLRKITNLGGHIPSGTSQSSVQSTSQKLNFSYGYQKLRKSEFQSLLSQTSQLDFFYFWPNIFFSIRTRSFFYRH